jgi:hypothetical protein
LPKKQALAPSWERLPAALASRQDAAPTAKNLTSLEAGYGAQRHPLDNEGWESLSASMIAARKPLPQEKITLPWKPSIASSFCSFHRIDEIHSLNTWH